MDDPKALTRATYNLTADQFDDAPLAPWAAVGRRTIELVGLAHGNRVLDVCCGTGSTALPAAEAVGRFGTVLGVDLAEGLLAVAARKAARRGLVNVEFRAADFERMAFPSSSCDAVVCQFGVFFLTDMTTAVRRMWSLVAPGGALAITTWGPRIFEPARGLFQEALAQVRPDLVAESTSCEQVSTDAGLRNLFSAAGANPPEVHAEVLTQVMERPEDFWPSMTGSGTRRTIEAMGPEAATRVREAVLQGIVRDEVTTLQSDVLYAVARKAAPDPVAGG